ncbi:hypothetical protein [Nonomuraea sp. LPB2021202275-12-8]|uniref:hypothetical protein n=1 Tax=Nonomuraea sp. LPB2021202275-12-8 TaxID=3120159 RepID=UPI00300CE4DF
MIKAPNDQNVGARRTADYGVHDVVLVGAEATGLSAALLLGRARRKVVVIDAGEPRRAPTAHMYGFLSRDGLAPATLLELGRAEIARYGVRLIKGRVEQIDQACPGSVGRSPAIPPPRRVEVSFCSVTLSERQRLDRHRPHRPFQRCRRLGCRSPHRPTRPGHRRRWHGSAAAFAINTDLLEADVHTAVGSR